MPALPPTAAKVDSDAIPGELTGPDGALLAADMLRRMLRVRLFEEATISLFDGGELPAMVHLSIGQEAAAVGACLATTDRDTMTGNHRSHGHPIAKGAALGPLMAELLGKAGGVCGGKGGSMHLADFSVGSLGESGIVASAIPVATGAGLSARVLRKDTVCLCFFGDGAANEGVFHESLNIASVWKLPVIYFCENNGYAVSVQQSESTAVADIARRAAGYDMPGVVVDGQDVLEVYRRTTEAVVRARAGLGPTLIEAKTYRFHEHAYGLRLPQEYLDPNTVQAWRDEFDPIELFELRLTNWGLVPPEAQGEIRSLVAAEVQAAVEFARTSPFPPAEDAYKDVFVDDGPA